MGKSKQDMCPSLETSGDTGEATWFQGLWITEGTCTGRAECSKTKFFTFYKIKVKTHALCPERGNRKEKQKMVDVMLILTVETRHVNSTVSS